MENPGNEDPYVISDSDGEDMLAHAIKLSLEKSPGKSLGKRKSEAIVISDDESDGQTSSRKVAKGSKAEPAREGGGGMSSMGMDRTQMERERLDRLGRGYLVSATGGQQKSLRERENQEECNPSSSTINGSAAAAAVESLKGTKTTGSAVKSGGPKRTRPTPMNLPFPGGVVKKTWVLGQPRNGDDIKFEEIFDPNTIYGAVLSAYQWDFEWVFSKIPPKKLQRFVMVVQAKREEDKEQYISMFKEFPRADAVFPPMEDINAMHSKLQLLFHKRADTGDDWLRIVIPTANLTSYDWGETGTLENMVFIIDLPRLPTPEVSRLQFPTELLRFCEAQKIPQDVLGRFSQYDFSATANMAFIHSIGGAHYDENIRLNTGYPGLGKAIKELGYASPKGHEIDFVTSSLGATHNDFIMSMYNAAMGCDGTSELLRRPPTEPKKKGNKKKKKSPPLRKSKSAQNSDETASEEESLETDEEETSWARVQKRFRIYFPSRETVRRSFGGLNGAGTISFVQDQWEEPEYPRSIVRDCDSVRKGLVMHNKIMFVRPPVQLETAGGKLDAWAYVGSANLSESAWGKLILNRAVTVSKIKIKCKNWECGVVIPIFARPNQSSGQTLSGEPVPTRTEPLGLEVFEKTVPVPMVTPAETLSEARPPWFFAEIYELRRKDFKDQKRMAKRQARGASLERKAERRSREPNSRPREAWPPKEWSKRGRRSTTPS
ncbi:putative tyrosyl-DNA phosphodiesterase [Morchella snyderi]|nr:putative tyrosyl-DNA phosphodiesterase [Morchella snyderi]